MHHFVVLGLAFGHRHAPLGRSRTFQHHARGGAGLAHRIVKIADGFRAVRILAAVFRVADGLLDLDARPIGVEFFRHHHRQRRADAGPHFGTMRDDDHAAIGFQAEIDAGLPGGIASRGARLMRTGKTLAPSTSAPAEKTPPRKPRRLTTVIEFAVHAFTPAAILTAWRIR